MLDTKAKKLQGLVFRPKAAQLSLSTRLHRYPVLNRDERIAEQVCNRQDAHRRRGRTKLRFNGKPDREVYRSLKLRQSEIAKVVSEMNMEPDADQWLSHAEWKELEGKAIAEAVRWALKERRAARRKNK